MRNDGRIIAFYSRHTTDRYHYYRTTTSPEDVTNWEQEVTLTLPENVTYSHAFHLSDENRTYLFTRCVAWHPTMLCSDDNGATWGEAEQFVGGGGARPYIKFVSDAESRIHFPFTDGHPRDEPSNSIYYAYYENGELHRANGMVIKDTNRLPLEPYEAEKVYDGRTEGKAWIWDIALDVEKRPVLVFAVFPDDRNHHYYYTRWAGTEWFMKDLVNAGRWFPQTPGGSTEREPNYSPGISLDHGDPSIVYLSRFIDGQCEIEQWTTDDGGETWDTVAITRGSSERNVRPIVAWPRPYGTEKPAKKLLFWMYGDYVHYTNYSTGIKYRVLADETAGMPRKIPARKVTAIHTGTELFTISGQRLRSVGGSQAPVPASRRLSPGVFILRDGQTVRRIETRSGSITAR
ncbi:MAG: BNR-4 repeat-containing protein [Chitinispirillaceae bacterium]|nr:BNR-4 repeat-containing protein [Chitinispirillaceae bacterium]